MIRKAIELFLSRTRGRELVSGRCVEQPTVVRNNGFELISKLQSSGDMQGIECSHDSRHQRPCSLNQLAAERDAINPSKEPLRGLFQISISSQGRAKNLGD